MNQEFFSTETQRSSLTIQFSETDRRLVFACRRRGMLLIRAVNVFVNPSRFFFSCVTSSPPTCDNRTAFQ
jgi:hypothetical protein